VSTSMAALKSRSRRAARALSDPLLNPRRYDDATAAVLDAVNNSLKKLELEAIVRDRGALRGEVADSTAGAQVGRASTRAALPEGVKAMARQVFIQPHLARTSPSALAEKIGIAQSSFSRWYHGRQRLHPENVARLADHLKVKESDVPN